MTVISAGQHFACIMRLSEDEWKSSARAQETQLAYQSARTTKRFPSPRCASAGEFGQCRDNVQDGIVYGVRFKNVSEPWIQYEARVHPSELKPRLEWRAIPPP
jgi:hypothetical protein